MSLENLDLTNIMAVKAEPGTGINQPPPPKAPQSEIVLQAGPGEAIVQGGLKPNEGGGGGRSQSEFWQAGSGEGLGPGGGTPPLTPYIPPKPGGGGGKSLPSIDFE